MNGDDPTDASVDHEGSPAPSSAIRFAIARGRVTMMPATAVAVAENSLKKGDVLSTARYAGVQAAKQTASLVVDVETLTLSIVSIRFDVGEGWIDIEARVECEELVDIESHALSAVSVAALTIFDMCKSTDRSMMIGALELCETSGGRLGAWRRDEDHSSHSS